MRTDITSFKRITYWPICKIYQEKLKQSEDEINKTFNKGRPKISRTPPKSFKKAWFTDSLKVNLSESTPPFTGVLLPTTSTYSSASSTVIAAHSPGMGRLPPALIKSLQTTDDCTPKSAATHAVSKRTDSSFSNLEISSYLSNFSSGTSWVSVENSRLPTPAT